jgi:membrane protein
MHMSFGTPASFMRPETPFWSAVLALAAVFTLARILDTVEDKARMNSGRERRRRHLGWAASKQVLYRTYQEFNNDRLLALAAGVVFYGLLALFPAITALVSCYALFSDPATISNHLALLQTIMPTGAYSIVAGQVDRIAETATSDLSLTFFVSLALSLWSVNAGVKAIIAALNIVYGVKDSRSIIRLNFVSLAFSVGTIVGLLLAISAIIVLPIVLSYLPLGGVSHELIVWLRWPALVVMLLVGLALLYHFGPNRIDAPWQLISVGAVFAAINWIIGSALLSFYLGNFANYGATYGSLGAAIGLMMWLWMTSISVLLGAELNSELDAAKQG